MYSKTFASIRIVLAFVISILVLTVEGGAQSVNDSVVFMNAESERLVCVVGLLYTPGHHCIPNDTGFLVQGRRVQFRVINRKFLSDYTFTVDGVTELKQVPIQDLEEAANLQVPQLSSPGAAAKGAVAKGLAATGQLPLRSAQDFLAELVNEGTAANPASELFSDWTVLQKEANKVIEETAALNTLWMTLNGAPPLRSCLQSFGAPTLHSTHACLQTLVYEETQPPWNVPPFANEDAFRSLILRINDAIVQVRTLSDAVSQSAGQAKKQTDALDSDLTSLNADLNAFKSNLDAARDGISVFNQLKAFNPPANCTQHPGASSCDALTALRRAEIKLRISQDFNSGPKPLLDDTELNQLTDAFITQSLATRNAISDAKVAALLNTIYQLQTYFEQTVNDLGGGNAPGQYYALTATNALRDGLEHFNTDLPFALDSINALQSQALARANEIYDHSEVAIPLDKMIDLGKHSGNLIVYFTVRRVDVFPRFTVPVVTLQGNVQPGALPPSTGTNVTGTPAPSSGGQDQGTGQVVAHGVVGVHDLYRATVVGAFAVSSIKDVSVKSKSITTGQAIDGSTCTTAAACSQPFLEKGSPEVSAMVGITYYLSRRGHDTYPGVHNRWNQNLGLMGGVAASRLNSYFAGLNYEPTPALQVGGGINFALQNTISAQFDPTKVYPGTPDFTGGSKWARGGFFTAGFNLSIFRKVFGTVTGLGTKATN